MKAARFNGWWPEHVAALRFIGGREWTMARSLPEHLRRALPYLLKHGAVERRPVAPGSHFYWYTVSWRGRKVLEQTGVTE